MKLAVDLHIHSALSPCGDEDMTPNNIINMCYLKGLDVISVTDHNSMLNNEAIYELGKQKDILVLPGIEVTTREEVHVLCYFKDINQGLTFSEMIYKGLPDIKNNEEIFGSQLIFDKFDNIVNKLDKLLLNSTKYSISDVYSMVKKHGGIMIPAHVLKKSYSILSILGFFPEDLSIETVEVSKQHSMLEIQSFLDIDKHRIIRNSDAHYLKDISERDFFITTQEKSLDSVFNYLSAMEEY